jgi:hypothetical protein
MMLSGLEFVVRSSISMYFMAQFLLRYFLQFDAKQLRVFFFVLTSVDIYNQLAQPDLLDLKVVLFIGIIRVQVRKKLCSQKTSPS